ncbi:MAG: hypothetical protein IJI13_05235, partial [Oscillospiraceae bacterium]|nr:hypothetical protein [Oscillospiraceae bacterium]
MLVLAIWFSPFRTFFAAALGTAFLRMRTHEADFIHTAVRIRPRPKNKPAFQPVCHLSARYTRGMIGFSRPIVYRFPGTGHTPRKLPRLASNLPLQRIRMRLRTHAQLIYQWGKQKSRKIFVQNAEIFLGFLCNLYTFEKRLMTLPPMFRRRFAV